MTALTERLAPAVVGPPSRAALLALAAVPFLLFGVGAAVSPPYALALVVGGIFAALVFRNLALGVAIFAVLTFFVRLPGTSAGGGAGVTIVKLGGIVLAAAWVVKLLSDSETPFLFRDAPLLAAAVSGLAVWTLASAIWAVDPSIAVSNALRYWQNILLVLIVFSALREPRHVRWIFYAFLVAAVFTALTGVSSGGADAAASDTSTRLVGRFGSGNPNYFAALLVPALVFAPCLLMIEKRKWVRVALITTTLVLLVALFQTESRGGLIALAATAGLAVVFAGRMRMRVLVAVVLTVLTCVAYFGAIASPASRARVTRLSSDQSSGRNDLWRVGLSVGMHHPVLGVGAGNFTLVSPRYAAGGYDITNVDYLVDTPKVTHNTYLNVWDDLGLVGLGLLCAAVAAAAVPAARRVRRLGRTREDDELELLGRALILALVGMLIASFFFSGVYQKQLWLLLGATAAVATIPSGAARRAVSAGRAPVR